MFLKKNKQGIFLQNSPNIGRKYRATSTFLQIYFVTLSEYTNEVRAN